MQVMVRTDEKNSKITPHTRYMMGMMRVQKKEGRIPYVRLVITSPGHITEEYSPCPTENKKTTTTNHFFYITEKCVI